MAWEVALGLARSLAKMALPRVGALLLLQWRLGLRPSEALRLRGRDLRLPRQPGEAAIVALGRRVGTKSGREEASIVPASDVEAMLLLRVFAASSAADLPFTHLQRPGPYNTLLRKAAVNVGMVPRWSGHCARAGWATTRWMEEQNFPKLREQGRWKSDASLRIYLDSVAIMDLEQTEDVKAVLPWLRTLVPSFKDDWSSLPAWW